MFEFIWIKISLFLTLELQFTALTEQHVPVFVVRHGDDVILPCENVTKDQDKCDDMTWLFADPGNAPAVELIKFGQIGEKAKSKSDRLSVTENCSLVIKKVTVHEDGYYTCRQTKSGKDTNVHLFVINMTEHMNDDDKVTVSCSVLEHERCRHRVEWWYEDKTVNGVKKDTDASQPKCSAVHTFTISLLKQKPNYPEVLKCKVTNVETEIERVFAFSPQSAGEKPGEDMTPVTTTKLTMRTPEVSDKSNINPTAWWLYVTVAVVVSAALTVAVVGVIRRRRSKGNKTDMDENDVQSLNPVVTPPVPDTADPEDGVSYASISFTQKKSSKAQTQVKDDEGDTVTYDAVKTSYNSSAAVSTEPSNIYATVNKPNK